MSTGSAQTETRNLAAHFNPNPKDLTKMILEKFIDSLQKKQWPSQVKEKLRELDWNKEQLRQIAAYAANDNATMEALNINPNKGLLLMGPIGCGKTEALLIARNFIKPGFKYENMHDLMLKFNTKGDAGLAPYRHGPIHPSTQQPIDCFFDDLGIERTGSYYGNKAEIGIDLIYMRHLLYKRSGAKSHFTTNMNLEELTNNYKDVSRSRLREMCNLIQFPKDAPDLRF